MASNVILAPPFGLSTVLRGIYGDLFPGDTNAGEPVDLTSGTLKSWSLGLGPAKVGRGSSSGSSSALDVVVVLALHNSRTKATMIIRRMNDRAARQQMAIFKWVKRSAKRRKTRKAL